MSHRTRRDGRLTSCTPDRSAVRKPRARSRPGGRGALPWRLLGSQRPASGPIHARPAWASRFPGLGERPLSGSPPLPGPPASGAQSRLPRPYRAAPRTQPAPAAPASPAAPPARHPRPGSRSLTCGAAAPRERWHLAGAERGGPAMQATVPTRSSWRRRPDGGPQAPSRAEGVVRLRTGLLRPDASELGFRRRVCMALGDADREALGCSGQG